MSNVYKKQRPFKISYFALVELKSWWRPCMLNLSFIHLTIERYFLRQTTTLNMTNFCYFETINAELAQPFSSLVLVVRNILREKEKGLWKTSTVLEYVILIRKAWLLHLYCFLKADIGSEFARQDLSNLKKRVLQSHFYLFILL